MFLLLHIYTFHKSSKEREAKNEALLHVASQIGCFFVKTKQKNTGLRTEGIGTHPETPKKKKKVPSVSSPQIC